MPSIKLKKFLLGLLILFVVILAFEQVFLLYQKGYFKTSLKKTVRVSPTPTQENLVEQNEPPNNRLGINEAFGEYVGTDGLSKILLSAIVASSPYLRDNFYYVLISFNRDSLESQIELLLGKEDHSLDFLNETEIQPDGTAKLQARPIKEVISFLKPRANIEFQMITSIQKDKLVEIRKGQVCKEECQEKLPFFEKYFQTNKEFIQSLRTGKNTKEITIGPAIQIILKKQQFGP